MKNFLRLLRSSWPYHRRLALSVACALAAAALWGLNFTAIYPVLKILSTEQPLHDWVDERIADAQKQIDHWQAQAEQLTREARRREESADREVTGALARLDGKVEEARRRLYRYQLAREYLRRFLPADCFRTLAVLTALVVLGVALRGAFEFGQEALVGGVVNRTLYDLRNRIFRNVIHLDPESFREQGTHELMARFTSDMDQLGGGLKTLYGKLVAEPLRALSCVAIACCISWQLTLLFLVVAPAALLVLSRVGRTMKRATRRLLERTSNIYKILQETFQGIRVVKAFTREPYERRRFRQATRAYYQRAMRVVHLDALSGPVIDLLGTLTVAAALLVGAYVVLHHRTHLGGLRVAVQPLDSEALLQLYALLAAVADPVRKLSSVYTRVQAGCAAADRVFAFADRRPRVAANGAGPRLPRHRAALEFRNVCFSYEPGRPILANVQLTVRFGETVALVGKNGCGKTTLAGLLLRFADPDHGSILIDGHDLRRVSLRSLRRQIGLVTQETILFDDTVAANIAYGRRRARPEEVERAARRAFAHDFIARLPRGYETRIGEAGAKLSGGQKQRLALARALLREPSILILDEFTSQTDAESEALIHRALRQFCRDRTVILITHRLHTLEVADRIVVLEGGRVAAVGTHAELLAGCPAYQRLHEAQFQRLSA
jgi:ATP-binding cassette subfamily B protein/subfamily B ATP-binding cassette protein MsbA